MEHLDFVDKLNEVGVSIQTTNVQGETKKIDIPQIFSNEKSNLIIKDFNITWENTDCRDPLKEYIRLGIDKGTWKHSMHHEIVPKNYDKFREIIQEKIIKRAEEIDELLSIYFQLQHEISKPNI